MQHIDVSRVIHAPIAKVFARYSDFPSWTRWARLGKVTVQRGGDASGVGAVRVIEKGPLRIIEEVTASDPPSALTYRLLSGLPIREHVGRVTFTPHGSNTSVHWECDFAPPAPGLGPLFRVVLAQLFRGALEGLDTDMRHPTDPAAS